MISKTKSRLDKSLNSVKQWAQEASPVRGHRLTAYLSGEGKLILANTDLFDYGMSKVDQSLLAAIDGAHGDANKHMAHAFTRMILANMFDIREMKGTDRRIAGNLDTETHLMLGAIAIGRPELVQPHYQTVLDGVDGGYGVHDGHNLPLGTTLRYAAFGLTIIGDWLGKPLDLDKHALPRDPAWDQLVAHWREPDPEKFLPILLTACDTHIERIALTEREDDTGQFEFGSVFLAVHPTEILAVLRLREIIGLMNPAHIDHPLMQTPYAAITCQPDEVTERDELLDRFLEVVRQRDPQVLPSGL
ncbi:hypothetical protein [Pectobacterium parmentieri]|uniref:Cytoplasmic protein n=2 Tax=Pectobacterium parmentieri TaxID=1905730 RepID=A0A0H3I434_PECPM|nr:hypothetical protein [Pectobacterium parmentieri]AFI88605.1 Putative cytoplasmic protein [Pectobacterium parmentieri]